ATTIRAISPATSAAPTARPPARCAAGTAPRRCRWPAHRWIGPFIGELAHIAPVIRAGCTPNVDQKHLREKTRRRNQMKRIALAIMLAVATALTAPTFVSAQSTGTAKQTPLNIPVTGTGGGATLAGTFQLQKFATDQGQLVATGILSGVI